MIRTGLGSLLIAAGLAFQVGAQPVYPEIRDLSSSRDPLFKQQQDLVDLAYQALASGTNPGDLTLFRYRTKTGETLFSLASRFNIPYETLATLNGLPRSGAMLSGKTLLISSQPGLFLALDHPTELDRLMEAWRSTQAVGIRMVVQRSSGPETVLFFSGQRFHPLERAFFLGILFRFPLPTGRLTSSFGVRSNPFTGHPTFHAGIDLAAPVGTEVYAARDGIVAATGTDPVLGKYVHLDHGDGYETVYGHLSFIGVSLHQEIRSSTILGRVGSTGMSTGPHLHFEIRRKGHAQDPVPLLPGRR